MELTELEKSILKVISNFDCLDYPLAILEIRRWLDQTADLSQAQEALDDLLAKNIINCRNGLYFIAGRDELAGLRLSRYVLADKKFAKGKRVAWWLKFFPWVRAIAVYSSLSYFNSSRESDIDFYIIAEKGRLWSCRFFVNLFLKVFRLRPTAKNVRDKICISLMSAADALDQSALLSGEDDLYYTYGTGQFIFFYVEDGMDKEFFSANEWIRDRLPNWQPIMINSSLKLRQQFPRVKKAREMFFGLMPEESYRVWQWKILPRIYKDLNNQDGRVVISDKIIKTHDNDKRARYNELFSKRYHQLLSQINES